MNIVLLGGPGAGKGTQAEKLVENFKMLHLSTGDMLREAVANGTEQGKLAKSYMDGGNLVPDEVIVGIIKEKLESEDISAGVIFDGFPRTIAQAEALNAMMAEIGSKLNCALLIDVADEVVVERICTRRTCKACGRIGTVRGLSAEQAAAYVCPDCGGEMYQRDDDNEATVKNRLAVYKKNTAPLVDFYKDMGILHTVDGNPTGDANNANVVFEEVKKIIS